MLNLKKQIRTLYITGVLGNLSLTGAWVVILAARGFSLVQIGFAETVFHITSLICEIPSGMLADMYGRKKMLVLGNLMAVTCLRQNWRNLVLREVKACGTTYTIT